MTLEGWIGAELDPPMFIVTVCRGGQFAGCLVGFATQCSIDPLLFTVFLSNKNLTYRLAKDVDLVAVHVVPEGNRKLAELFGGHSGDRIDKFALCDWRPGPGGVPILRACDNWFVGRILNRAEQGDHMALVLEPLEGAARPARALGFQAVRDIRPGHDA